MKPTLFIGSSAEGVSVAYAAQQNLQHVAEVTVWDQGVFRLSQTNLESLLAILDRSDFGIFVFSPDDLLTIRGQENVAVRDNVLFELGLFVGRLKRERCFILVPDNATDLRFPTDLLGMTPGSYETDRSDGSFQAATGPACHGIREAIQRLGQRSDRQQVFSSAPESRQESKEETDDTDKKEITAQKAEETHPDLHLWFDAYIKKDYQRALELMRDRIAALDNEEERPNLEAWEGRIQYCLNPTVGTEVLENVISHYPTEPGPYMQLAYAHLGRDLFEECLATFDRGIAAASKKAGLFRGKARVLQDIGREDDAVRLLKDTIRAEPFHASYSLELAKLLQSLKKADEAREVIEKGLTQAPDDKDLLSEYARLLAESTDKKLALIPYNRLVALDPKNLRHLCLRANLYLELGLNDLAMISYKKASELAEHKQAWILGNIGNLYKNCGIFTDAVEYLKKALEIAPDDDYAHDRLAISIKKREEENEQLQTLVKEAYKALAMKRVSSD